MENRQALWAKIRRWAPEAHRDGTTPEDVARRVQQTRRGLKGVKQVEVARYAVLLSLEVELKAMAGRR